MFRKKVNKVKALSLILMLVLVLSGINYYPRGYIYAAGNLLAFPGAEGGGKYTTGARGNDTIEVYHVTNLNASGAGSLAEGLSQSGRIIVFDVGGTIELKSQLRVNKNNITILGQTAPGDGITISGADMLIDDGIENVIIRYLRIRPTDKNGGEPDGLGGRWNKDIIIDHCSVSWSVDELLTLYAGSSENDERQTGRNITIQNTMGSESLAMSSHVKGKHGYGAIVGATDYTFYHNLLAHHDSRSPRFDRELGSTDVENNIIYNWGQTNSAYGGEPYSVKNITQNPSNINYANNYCKFGPSTASKIKSRIFDVSNGDNVKPYSNFYFSGNYVFGDSTVTSNNTKGVNNLSLANLLTAPIDMGDYKLPGQTATDAYNEVLSDAGATLPKRDAIDARIIDDVKHQTGRIINNADEVGGLIPAEPTYRTFEIPEDWKVENGMGSAVETDIVQSGKFEGYTWVEAYVNDWTEKQQSPTNPEIVVMSPAIASVNSTINGNQVNKGNWTVIKQDQELNYHALATAIGGNEITKFELYDRNSLIKSYEASVINDNITLEPGIHYLTCRAYNTRGEKTQSTTSIVYVKSIAAPGSFSYSQIGTGCSFDNQGGASMDENGVYTISASGLITTAASDKCGFMYKQVNGDFDITVNIYDIPKFENGQVSGLMLRESLANNSKMIMLADGWDKYGENVSVLFRSKAGGTSSRTYFKNKSGTVLNNSSSYDTSSDKYHMPRFMRIQRQGNNITLSVSDSGLDWTDNPRQPMTITISDLSNTVYLGIANESAQGTSTKEYFSMAKYRNLTLNGQSDTEFKDLNLPINDGSFDLRTWYGIELSNQNGRTLFGNSGDILGTWLYANRSFMPQSKGIVTTSFDCLTAAAKGKCDFILRGVGGSGVFKELIKIIAEPDQPFILGGNQLEGLTVTANTWYKVTIEQDYYTSRANISIYPYETYDDANNDYVLSDTGIETTVDFDGAVPVGNIRFVSEGAQAIKYFDNVSVSVDKNTSYIRQSADKIDAFATQEAKLYLVAYDESNIVTDVQVKDVPLNQESQFDKPVIPTGGKVRAYLWNVNLQPLCDAADINAN